MGIMSLTFEQVFNNLLNEQNDMPEEDIALECMIGLEELLELDTEVCHLESILEAQVVMGIVTTEAEGDAGAGTAEPNKPVKDNKLKETFEKVKAKVIELWGKFTTWVASIARKVMDFFQFNAKWFKENEVKLKEAWPTAMVPATAKVKNGKGIFTLVKEMQGDINTIIAGVKAVKADTFEATQKSIEDRLKEGSIIEKNRRESPRYESCRCYFI